MDIGVGLPSFATDTHTIPPDRFRRFARLADDYGFTGAWLIEHLRENPNYATSQLDPLTTLAHVAGETERIPLGTSVLLLPLRHPVLVAKRAVTIQHLASRRLTLGLGAGYVPAEFDAVGVPMAERSARYLEGIELLRHLLHEDEVTFDGEFYSVDEFRLEPQLGQPPRILAGGGGVETDDGRHVARGVKARLRFADGWIAPPSSLDPLVADWSSIADYLDQRDLEPDAMERVALQYLHLVPGEDGEGARRKQRRVYQKMLGPDRSLDTAMTNWLTGSVEEVKESLEGYQRAGFDEVILHPMTTVPSELEQQIKSYERHLLDDGW